MRKYILKKTLIISIAILFFGVVIAPSLSGINHQIRIKNPNNEKAIFNPFQEGWKYRKKITIDSDKVAGNLVNFPILVSTIDSDLASKAQSDADDIIFMDDKGEANQLFHEIESYVNTNGELVAWVNIPSLSSAADTKIFMYYGNPDCTSQETPESVWDSYYCSVWHLNDFEDSTINANHGANHGTDDTSGKIGKGKSFNSEDTDYISWGDLSEPANDMTNKATFESWFNPDTMDMSHPIVLKYNTGYEPDEMSYCFKVRKTGEITFRAASGTYYSDGRWIEVNSDPVVTTDNWNHIVAVIDLSTQDMKLYHNGVALSVTKEKKGTPPSYFYDAYVNDESGRQIWESSAPHINGKMDELRISKVLRSPEWITTEFNNQNDVSSFLKFGREIRPRTSTNENILIQRFFVNHPNIAILLKLIFG